MPQNVTLSVADVIEHEIFKRGVQHGIVRAVWWSEYDTLAPLEQGFYEMGRQFGALYGNGATLLLYDKDGRCTDRGAELFLASIRGGKNILPM